LPVPIVDEEGGEGKTLTTKGANLREWEGGEIWGRRGDFYHEGHKEHEEIYGINLRILAPKGRQMLAQGVSPGSISTPRSRALKGRDIIAQGNALGIRRINKPEPCRGETSLKERPSPR
jgi:hypothetical protein